MMKGINGDSMKITEGQRFTFKASSSNTGCVTVQRKKLVTVKRNGIPVNAADIQARQVVYVDTETGEMTPASAAKAVQPEGPSV